jgi:hypothetical protein
MVSEIELHAAAFCAVQDNARHSEESLFELLAALYPEATEEQLDEAVRSAL